MARAPSIAAEVAPDPIARRVVSFSPAVAAVESLPRTLVYLALPILAENLLGMLVGVVDTALAGHLSENPAAATAAVGSVAYILWLVSLVSSAIATGATAIVSRAIGAKHKSLANSVTGQAVTSAAMVGLITAIAFAIFAKPLADLTGLTGIAHDYAQFYFRVLSFSLPFSVTTVAAGACLRGAGDTLWPAIAMATANVVNMILSYALTFGAFGLPALGFKGIAIGTVIAYTVGGAMLVAVLLRGSKVRLHLHRLRPHWNTLKRLWRIGLPSGIGDGLTWIAQFAILNIINDMDRQHGGNLRGAAHLVTIRVESFSFTFGLAFMTATAALVGQSLGRKDPVRATRVAWIAFAFAAAIQLGWGAAFLLIGEHLAGLITSDPATINLATQCLHITAFAQLGFAATLIFGGALRGAGDVLAVTILNVASQVGLRLVGALVLTQVFHFDLPAVWIALGGELTLRGLVIFLRFAHGGWKQVKV